jgi:hypothetical protein
MKIYTTYAPSNTVKLLQYWGVINLTFRRNFGVQERAEWDELERDLEGIELNDEVDSVRWMLTTHGGFTTASLYRHWSFPEVRDVIIEEMWRSKLPLKIKNFMWLVQRGRLQMVDNLIRKQWKGGKFCQFCQAEKSVDHLMFECPVAVFVWAVIRDGLK